MIRVVAEHAPNLLAILGVVEQDSDCPQEITIADATYYRARSTPRWVLYKAALSGWGAAAPNPDDPRPVFNPSQR